MKLLLWALVIGCYALAGALVLRIDALLRPGRQRLWEGEEVLAILVWPWTVLILWPAAWALAMIVARERFRRFLRSGNAETPPR